MKNLVFTALVGLAMITFTGCTTGSEAEAATKCSASGKCAAKKVESKCAASGKCGAEKAASKCAASGKCGK